MTYILHGIGLGLTLTILIGPIFVALTQTGMEKGARAGLMVGAGIWFSDILVISVGYFFIKEIQHWIQDPLFHRWLGFCGGIILFITGITTMLKKTETALTGEAYTARTYLGFWTKGFSVNFFNPFTFVFWLGVMTSYVIGKGINGMETLMLFGAIMGTIMITDSLKVFLGKYIRSKANPEMISRISKVAGIALCIFGLILIGRTNQWF